jgi:4-amino-4-deoxy-L-arabinose transferase-like glycosyltransferase
MPASRLFWPLLIAVALAVRLVGIGWGLPNLQHAYPYNPDEWTPMQAFRNMHPRQLDFNPHYFDNPTLFYYMIGASTFALHLAGGVKIDGDEAFYFQHPEHLARILLLGRLLAALFGVATVWLTYLLARRLGLSRGASGLAASLLALHPSHVVHSHFMTVNTAVTCWTTATFVLVARWVKRGGLGPAIAAGAVAGLAMSTKYPALLLLPVLAAAGPLRLFEPSARPLAPVRAVGESAASIGAALLTFVLGSPYLVIAFSEAVHSLGHLTGREYTPTHASFLATLKEPSLVHLAASTPLLVAAALAGAYVLLRRPNAMCVLLLGWLTVFFVASSRAPSLATDSRFLPAFPVIAVLGAAALGALATAHRRVGLVTAGAVMAGVAVWCVLLLGRFVGPSPQEVASRWARENVRSGERVLVTGTAGYWGPDLVVREYLQEKNATNYPRSTGWVFVAQDSFRQTYDQTRRLDPDVVFLTEWLPSTPVNLEWLRDPSYRVVATFPGKLHVFGKRLHPPLDTYDIDIWVLRRM